MRLEVKKVLNTVIFELISLVHSGTFLVTAAVREIKVYPANLKASFELWDIRSYAQLDIKQNPRNCESWCRNQASRLKSFFLLDCLLDFWHAHRDINYDMGPIKSKSSKSLSVCELFERYFDRIYNLSYKRIPRKNEFSRCAYKIIHWTGSRR